MAWSDNRGMETSSIFLKFAEAKIRQQKERIVEAIQLLPDEAFWQAPNAVTNSVAQLLLHLSGNVRQWILHGVGGAEDQRERDEEFALTAASGLTRAQVEAHFSDTVEAVAEMISGLPVERLGENIDPQGYKVNVLEAIFHVTEHFSYHAGQIFLLVKLNSQSDLGFYRHLGKPNKTHSEVIP